MLQGTEKSICVFVDFNKCSVKTFYMMKGKSDLT